MALPQINIDGLPAHKDQFSNMLENNLLDPYAHFAYSNTQFFFMPQITTFPMDFQFYAEPANMLEVMPIWPVPDCFNQAYEVESHVVLTHDNTKTDLISKQSKQSQAQQKSKRGQTPRFRPTKNNESNISNQAFSFMATENKSRDLLMKLLKNRKKVDTFYEYARSLTSKRKKYMSKLTLFKLCTLTDNLEFLRQYGNIKPSSNLSMKEFELGVSFLVIYFLKHKSTLSILTSQKISAHLKKDHLLKTREILNSIQENLALFVQKKEITDLRSSASLLS